jgi:hypothetical protein
MARKYELLRQLHADTVNEIAQLRQSETDVLTDEMLPVAYATDLNTMVRLLEEELLSRRTH